MSAAYADPRWRGLFATAGAGAILTALFIPLQVVVFIAWPPPTSHSLAAWFELFTTNPLLGLVSLDLLMMVEQVLMVPVVLAIWLLAHRASESAALLGAVLWLAGGLLILTSNTGFEMLSLSRGYAAASTPDQATYLAAAQGMLASYWDMGTSFVFGYVLTSAGGILVGVVMIRARLFGVATGRLLVVSNVVALGLFIPGVGVVLALASVLIVWSWCLRVGWCLVRVARVRSDATRAVSAAVTASSPAL